MIATFAYDPEQVSDSGRKIAWYRSPVSREELIRLNRRSDGMGFLQTGGYLGVLACTGTAAMLSVGRLPWPAVVALFLLHGICGSFTVNGFHELVHESVFKTQFLNRLFLAIISFLGWHNPVGFWATHAPHHKYALHPPDDPEVMLPGKQTLKEYCLAAIVNPRKAYGSVKGTIRTALGRVAEGQQKLFPESDPELRHRYFTWARWILLGHVVVAAGSFALGLWLLPVVISFCSCYGSGVYILCNASQHIGLTDKVDDFRLNSRTIILNPIVRFLYWHMNFHIEHHMYAAVPCYHLGRLHKMIRDDLPYCPRGLMETWMQIAAIQKRQKVDPDYQYVAVLPAPPEAGAVGTVPQGRVAARPS